LCARKDFTGDVPNVYQGCPADVPQLSRKCPAVSLIGNEKKSQIVRVKDALVLREERRTDDGVDYSYIL